MQQNIFWANVLYIFHMTIIAFVLFAPFCNILGILLVHVVFCASLFVHWRLNSNVCSLSVIESKLRGLERTDTFTHSLIAPIYDVSSTTWGTITTIITLVLMYLSINKLLNPKMIEKFKHESSILLKKWRILF